MKNIIWVDRSSGMTYEYILPHDNHKYDKYAYNNGREDQQPLFRPKRWDRFFTALESLQGLGNAAIYYEHHGKRTLIRKKGW